MKHCFVDFPAPRGLLEQLSSNSNASVDNIVATQPILVNQALNRPIRSLKIIAKELMKVLKESGESWQDDIAVGSDKAF
jgi:hypothetical protein